ncbi:mechanosensitive ion channel [Escherichia coli]|uniref:mechanosensitive ion channel domain-containing protein n=1 Tax=Escherichia coli TaxID=562 RepID=UPI00287A71B7|nr:mechanosensitive ion channel domain-containing protein [Escherichia coli]MDS1661700.1 mechanosensitive ion channel [Escherichia coli]
MRWILFILFCLLGAPAHAVSIPGVTTTTTTDSTTEPAPEPDIEQKKAAYGALADVLDNDTSRKELIDQLRTVAATPPAEPVPKIVPPTLVEEQTVLQKVTEVSRHYGEALSARFGQLYRNITGSPHKPFNPQTFSNALTHFSMLAVLVFGFYWLIRLCALPLYRKMGQWARQKNRERSNWLQLPAMIIGAFIIDLLLLALTLFVGQVLSDNLNAGSRTIAFQQSLFLNAFALIEFFKAVLRLIFCPNVAELRPFTIQDESARYWSRRLSWLSSLIGYGLIVAVRQDTGAYHIIPWSSITTFANFVRGIGSVVANYDVDRHEDADKANQALKDAVAELMENEEIRGLVIGEPNFAGIVGLSNTAFTLRVSFTTLPLKQWTVRFALDSQVKKHFDLAGVRAPVQTYQVLPAPGAAPAEPLPPGEPTL